jgi:RNA binding exosome subunit
MDTLTIAVNLLILLALVYVTFFLRPYLLQKAKNIATHEDIALLTNEIEKVKAQYARELQNIKHQNDLLIEELRGHHQLRLAALDRRLQAHQEAYTRWRRLIFRLTDEDIQDLTIKCQDWWENNCLYLSSEARQAFYDAFILAWNHKNLVEAKLTKEMKYSMSKIHEAGEKIVKGVELPTLNEGESKILQKS